MRERIGLFFLIFIFLEVYIYQSVKLFLKKKWQKNIYVCLHIFLYLFLLFMFLTIGKNKLSDTYKIQTIMGILVAFFIPKILLTLFLLIDDIFRIVIWLFSFQKKEKKHYPQRRKFFNQMGVVLASVFSLAVLDGIFFGKYRHWVRRVRLRLSGTPKAFRGYKIVQISDVHIGSFFSVEKIEKAVALINEQNPDIVVFTGDLVNYHSDEFLPFVSLFSKIKAKDGKFSVLGNHDYGIYYTQDKNEQKKHLEKLIQLQNDAGFQVLRNESRYVEKNGEKLYIIGVENWGVGGFPQFGDLDKAVEDVTEEGVKILLSHDPSHFSEVVQGHFSKIPLTLSGHTHGLQFGLDLGDFRWSPVQYKYPYWLDLYEAKGQYLYVNRGFGVIGFPGRVGVNPEITLFELL